MFCVFSIRTGGNAILPSSCQSKTKMCIFKKNMCEYNDQKVIFILHILTTTITTTTTTTITTTTPPTNNTAPAATTTTSTTTTTSEGRKEMFYLTTHSSHFIYAYMASDHLYNERGIPLPSHGFSFRLAAMVFYMHHHSDRITHTTAFVVRFVDHWLKRELSQWVHH